MSSTREALLADAVMVDKMEPPAPPDWWRGAILYEVYWRSFLDSNGDGVGDLTGVRAKLDYIADLGADAIWLAPFYASPQEDFGYDIVDARSVDALAGTMNDFLELIEAAHDRDLKVVLDFIPIHTSNQHPWFIASRRDRENDRADWYIWADGASDGGPPNNWLSSFGGSAWTWEPRRSQYYYHPFLPCQPGLNLRTPETLEAVLGDMRFWLDHGVDGFRLDAVQCLACDPALRSNPPTASDGSPILLGGGPHNPFRKQLHLFDRDVPEAIPIIERMRAVIDEYDGERVLIGERADVDSSRAAEKYTVNGKRFHAVYDFDLINCRQEEMAGIVKLRDNHLRTGWVYNVFTNHDSIRALTNMAPLAKTPEQRRQAAKMLLFLQFTLKGGGALFQGEELGLPQPKLPRSALRDPWGINLWPDFEGRDGVRTPMPWQGAAAHAGFSEAEPWLPLGEGHAEAAVDRQAGDKNSVLCFARAFFRWRKRQPLILRGGEKILDEQAPLVVYDRYAGQDRLRCIVNLSPQTRLHPHDDAWRALSAPGCSQAASSHGVELQPFGFAVLETA